MACRALLHTLPLLTTIALACGPGKDTTADESSSQASTADDSTGGTTTGSTTGQTATEPTTGQTTDKPMTVTSEVTEATTPATEPTSATSGPTSDPTTDPTASTTDATTGEPACPDQLPEDGTPCENEGQFCGGPCEDPCSFCNVTKCEGGMWSNLEVFPANCLDCDTVCDFVVEAECAGGPPDEPACVAGCMNSQDGGCKIPFNQMLACIGDQPAFTCDALTRPTVVGCETQFEKLYECMNL